MGTGEPSGEPTFGLMRGRFSARAYWGTDWGSEYIRDREKNISQPGDLEVSSQCWKAYSNWRNNCWVSLVASYLADWGTA